MTSTSPPHPRAPTPRAACPRRGGGQRPVPRCREGPARVVEHPGAPARTTRCATCWSTSSRPTAAPTSLTPAGTPTTPSARCSSGMAEAGCDIGDVQGVMVTHIHPDHYGLAGRIREASGAWISLHPADAELIHDRYDEPDDLLDRVAAALRRMGAPAEELEPLQQRRHAGPPSGRRRRTRPVARGRSTPGGAGVGPAGHLDAGTLAGPPVLLRVPSGADALGRPRAAPHHPEHPVPPPGRGEPAGRLSAVARQARALPRRTRSCRRTSIASTISQSGSKNCASTTATASAR